MKASEFRKLIREEIRKVLKEKNNILKNTKVSTDNHLLKSKLQQLFGSFLTIKQGPTKSQYVLEYVVDLDVDALVSLLKSNKDYSVLKQYDAISVYYKGGDSLEIKTEGLPEDVITTLEKVGRKDSNTENLVSLQIGDEADGFENPEEYSLPTVVQSAVGDFSSSADPEDEDAYSDEIDLYLDKIEKALLVLGRKAVPELKKYAKEDGFIIFKLPAKLDVQTKTKLNNLFKGVKSVEY